MRQELDDEQRAQEGDFLFGLIFTILALLIGLGFVGYVFTQPEEPKVQTNSE